MLPSLPLPLINGKKLYMIYLLNYLNATILPPCILLLHLPFWPQRVLLMQHFCQKEGHGDQCVKMQIPLLVLEFFSGGRCGGRRRRRNLVDQSEDEFSNFVQCGSMEYRPTRFSLREQLISPDGINWEELFTLQHQDGYWECTRSLSRFLGLDIDFFANVFLKEKGICSLGVKAHADILKLVATLLVLQLMRVKKMVDVELFQSLFRLSESPEPRPACYDAVKKAVDWVCWADRQYPCVCSRLEFGLNWESCTRQLLGLDSLPPCSPLTPVLQRSRGISVM